MLEIENKIKALLALIEDGDAKPRDFEALAQLQRMLMEAAMREIDDSEEDTDQE